VTGTLAFDDHGKFKLKIEFLENYARTPPRLSSDVIAAQEAAGILVRNPIAPTRHQMTKLEIVVGL
jgi:hypothetical protein